MLVVDATAGIADQIGGVALPLGPSDACPCDRGHVAAMLARHMEIPLVAVEVGRLDAGVAFQRRRGHHVDLAPPSEGGGALDLIEKRHNDRFFALLTDHYPAWREARAELNEIPLTAEAWKAEVHS